MDAGIRTFEIAHCLGRGGFGEVYRATMRTQGGLESDVAVKVLRKDLDPAGQAVQRLRDEGRLLAKLDHPVILRVHDLAVLEGRVALVTEYIAGEDLETLMKGSDRITVRGLLQVIGQVGHALDAAWNAPLRDGTPLNLVHRDIKPSNIRIGRHGEVKLLDFGIARTDAVAREARTRTDMMVGSPAYMAPERFRSNATDPASDVFALGATLYEGVTRRRFYGRMDFPRIAGVCLDEENYAEHLEDQLSRIRDDVDPELVQLISDSLRRETADRISSAELADRAELLAEKQGGDSLARWCRARRWRPEPQEQAELSGKTLSGDTIERVAPLSPSSPPSMDPSPALNIGSLDETIAEPPPVSVQPVAARSGPPGWFWGVLVLFVVGGGFAGLGALGIGGFAWQASQWGLPAAPDGTDEELEPEPAPDPVPDEVPEPEPAPRPAPEPAPATPRPEQPAPARPTPAPAPAPVAEPEPEPVAQPEPVASATAEFVQTGDPAEVTAKGAGGTVKLPGPLSAGSWAIEVSFAGGAPFPVDSIEVAGGETWNVHCSKRGFRCNVSRL